MKKHEKFFCAVCGEEKSVEDRTVLDGQGICQKCHVDLYNESDRRCDPLYDPRLSVDQCRKIFSQKNGGKK